MHDDSSAYSASSAKSSAMSASSDSDTSADTKDRRYKKAEQKFDRDTAKKKTEKA